MISTRESRFLKLKANFRDLFLEAARKEFPEGHNSGLSRAIQKRFGISVSKATVARILAGKRGDYTNVKAICEYYEDLAQLELWQDACEDDNNVPKAENTSSSTNDIDALVREAKSKVRFSFESAVGVGDNDQTAWVKHHFVELDMVEVKKLPSEYPALNREVLESSQESIEDEFDRMGIRLLRGKKTNGSKILKKYPRIFVYGDPGSGKTSYLQSVALRCRENILLEKYVPAFVDIRHYSASDNTNTLRTHIEHMFEQWGLTVQHFEQLLVEGRVLFLFDGLDEVPEGKRLSIQFMLQEILSIYSDCRLICSSRLAAVFQLRGIQKVVISPFYSRKQIPLFVKRWFSFYNYDSSMAEAMLEKLYSSKYVEIREIARRPVLLKLLCITYEHNGDFPNKRADVFATGLNVLAKRIQYDNTVVASEPLRFTEVDVKNIVARVASYFFVYLGEQILFSVRDVERIIRTYYEEVHNVNPDMVDGGQIVRRIEHFNGLLVCWGGTYCSFSHLTYQEYFTAEHLVNTGTYARVYDYLTDRRWSFVIELISELIPREQSWRFFIDFKNTIDEYINGDTKLIHFLSRVEQAAAYIALKHRGNKAFIQPLTRAWYFAYALENTGSITSFPNYRKGFALPDLDFATSMVSDEILQGHEILYQAYHLCSSQDAYDKFESSIVKLRRFFDGDSRIEEVIDGWRQLIAEQKVRFSTKHEWWDAKRKNWQKKVANLLDNQGLPHVYNLNQEQLRRLRTYYRTSKLLSVCINCSTLPRDRLIEMVNSILRITYFIPDQESETLGLF